MAEGLFKAKTREYSKNLKVSSCGLGAMTGDTAAENAIAVMAECGIDISAHRSRQINQYIIDEADYIVCLSHSHYKFLKPIAENKLILLGEGISDPFGGNIDVYRECADEIESAIDDLLRSDVFIEIKKMTTDDIDCAVEIENINFSEPWSKLSFESQIEKRYSVCFAAHYLGKAVGYICCDDICDEVYVGTIAVDNNFRRRGIGRRLVQSVIDYCKKSNSSLLTLEVRVSNTSAVNLYTSLGFENLGVRKNFYSKPTEDAYIMTKYFNGDKDENISN